MPRKRAHDEEAEAEVLCCDCKHRNCLSLQCQCYLAGAAQCSAHTPCTSRVRTCAALATLACTTWPTWVH